MGAGEVRLNNPDARPFLLDEASGRIDWVGDAKRLRISDLAILAGETHVNAHGWLAPPPDPAGAWAFRLESKDTRFGPERRGEAPVVIDSLVADARFLASESRFVLDGLTVRGRPSTAPSRRRLRPTARASR